jgi:hypothetical protein
MRTASITRGQQPSYTCPQYAVHAVRNPVFQILSVFAARLKEHCGRSNGSLPADMSTALLTARQRQGPSLEPKFHAKESFTLARQLQRQSHLGEPVASRVECCLCLVKDKGPNFRLLWEKSWLVKLREEKRCWFRLLWLA